MEMEYTQHGTPRFQNCASPRPSSIISAPRSTLTALVTMMNSTNPRTIWRWVRTRSCSNQADLTRWESTTPFPKQSRLSTSGIHGPPGRGRLTFKDVLTTMDCIHVLVLTADRCNHDSCPGFPFPGLGPCSHPKPTLNVHDPWRSLGPSLEAETLTLYGARTWEVGGRVGTHRSGACARTTPIWRRASHPLRRLWIPSPFRPDPLCRRRDSV
ncbi:hypothetical protein PYCCODRAFT_196673 [Trametes coccinea BRFM310]|uniref:Uncharacterized protein n=1 Tax=Trametes coccinea (strain BRFM310) TaxID=1353009 RepID=A0A1Y2IRM8_TRAC3|nr:hypothetical protein PYCCODRAFT_196673 [Trametes coccinea BRFM310]